MTALCGLFYGSNKMATDVDVQYFSHLNGLTLGNNWGDLIRLLDKALVTGINFTQITAASIDTQGDVHITLYAAHNAMLFQVVELSGFTPNSLNQKYRIKGVPNTTQLILKPALDIAERSITAIGTGKLVSLGYEIIFRDPEDVKRVYRAKNPSAQHPFIRVDESLASDTGTYTSTYAKSAMVGLLEHMDHIDDYENPNVLQLPFDPANPSKNWKIIGTGSSVVKGWSRWYWRRSGEPRANVADSIVPSSGNAQFTLVGDFNAFYFMRNFVANGYNKILSGCGLFDGSLPDDLIPNWFLMAYSIADPATSYLNMQTHAYATPLIHAQPFGTTETYSKFLLPSYNITNKYTASLDAVGVLPSLQSGYSGIYSSNILSALEVPIVDSAKYLRGTLKHICFDGNNTGARAHTTPLLSENSMYVRDTGIEASGGNTATGFYFYIGELE